MHAVGIHSQVKDGRAVVRVVVLDKVGDDWLEARKFTHSCDQHEELPQQMLNLADDLHHQFDGLTLGAAILRDRDHHSGPVNAQHLKVDHTADGVILAALRRQCPETRMLPGNGIGELCGSDKATAETQASQRFGASYKEAGAAALAATTLV